MLNLDLNILSIDVLAWGEIFTRYTEEVRAFLSRGGIISWGIVPTLGEEVAAVTAPELLARLEDLWSFLAGRGISREQILAQAWLAPARCCLVDPDESGVERAFSLLKEISERLKDKYQLET